MKKIAFIILHFRSLENTTACLDSVVSMERSKNFKAIPIVVDNASDEPFPKKNDVHVIRNNKNKGFTGGMNTGMRYALSEGFDYVLIVNNDTVFDKTFLKNVSTYLEKESDGGIFVPKIYFFPGTEYHYDRYNSSERGKVLWFAGGNMDWKNLLPSHRGVDEVDTNQYNDTLSMDFATGCCMIFPREVLKDIGMFDDSYYLYFEDIDLSLRMKKAGKKLIFMPKAHLWHKNAKSAGGAGSNLQDYYMTRNRLLLGMKYASLRTKLALLKEGVRLVVTGRTWQKKGVRDFFFGKFGKGSFPI